MRAKVFLSAAVVLAAVWAVGCGDSNTLDTDDAAAELPPVPPEVEGTVAEYARLVHGGAISVQGYGIVVGLGDKGSSEVPSHLAGYLEQYLRKQDLGRWTRGTESLTPQRILRDRDTTVVLIGGSVPPGAPAGTRFDLHVTCLPQTQTRSLEGGILMPAELRLAVGGVASPGGPSRVVAEGAGSVLVNPFMDSEETEARLSNARRGRVVGGGKVLWSRGLRIQLLEPDYSRCDLIGRRINARFGSASEKPANPRDSSVIELTVPREYRGDYRHFLDLVMHLPLEWGPSAEEGKAWEVGRQMEQANADRESLALIWEAIGRQILPVVKEHYTSDDPRVAYYAARTGLRLGDESALEIVLQAAGDPDSSLQTDAIRELGRHPHIPEGRPLLEDLLNDQNEFVRFTAYRALLRRGGSSAIRRVNVSGEFEVHAVKSDRRYVIYASQTDRPRIVLFGQDMTVQRPVFYNSPDDLVTINAHRDDDKLLVYRKIPSRGDYSDPFYVDCYVRELVRTLGDRPEPDDNGDIKGLGLTYGQVVSVLYRMCEEGDIPAKFVLQPLPELQRIYQEMPEVGRPDAPAES
ncbi:MAG: flagellar basal body P-ring protein FlgI [Phycisphaerae bacterium]